MGSKATYYLSLEATAECWKIFFSQRIKKEIGPKLRRVKKKARITTSSWSSTNAPSIDLTAFENGLRHFFSLRPSRKASAGLAKVTTAGPLNAFLVDLLLPTFDWKLKQLLISTTQIHFWNTPFFLFSQKVGHPRPFSLFSFFSNIIENNNCRLQRDSNYDRQSLRRARCNLTTITAHFFIQSMTKLELKSDVIQPQGDQMVWIKSRQMSIKSRLKLATAVFTLKLKEFDPLKIVKHFGPNNSTHSLKNLPILQ